VFDTEVPGEAMVEGTGRNADQPVHPAAKQIGRAVVRRRIDRDDLERKIDALARDRIEHGRKRACAVPRGHHDRHFHGTDPTTSRRPHTSA
jgi:hypothetical protein